jgi:hypothetical protein
MEARANESERIRDEAVVTELGIAIRLVSRGLARSVMIVGIEDPEAVTAAVAVAPGVSVEMVPPSAVRVTRAVSERPLTLTEAVSGRGGTARPR